ncbi:MAG: chemotaxis protein CheD [Romboutsia sp.]|nr:chemotaxis protein CheD [Romboutsia sp.]
MDDKLVKINIADYKVSKYPNKLITLGLGSCIGICIYDEKNKIGGIAHIMLPEKPKNRTIDEKYYNKYADVAIEAMFNEIIKQGGKKDNLVAKIVGGANMFEKINTSPEDSIGFKNQIVVKKILQKLNIPIIAEELGGNTGRTLILDLKELKVSVRSKGEIRDI